MTTMSFIRPGKAFTPLATVLVTMALLAATGCAEPKYVREEGNNRPPPTAQKAEAADCRIQFPVSQLCLTWTWIHDPIGREKGSLIFKTFRPNNFDSTPVLTDPEGTPKLVLMMPSMGHGSRPTTLTPLDTGTFRVDNVVFTMPDEWELWFQILDGGKVIDEVRVPYFRK